MKRILLLLIAVVAMVACDKDNNKVWDANAMISLRCAKGARSTESPANPNHLSALEIVKQAEVIIQDWQGYQTRGGFAPAQRDYVNERLLMWSTAIIDPAHGGYQADWIEARNTVLARDLGGIAEYIEDTIAYIPNRVLIAAQKIIKPAYDRGDYDLVYKTFNEAFTFIPITGAEYRALEAKGEN
ncbi:MAG: hypothetical protein RR258_03990 [Alistipes sp.]